MFKTEERRVQFSDWLSKYRPHAEPNLQLGQRAENALSAFVMSFDLTCDEAARVQLLDF